MTLTDDQKRWLLSARPDNWHLDADASDEVIYECICLGLIEMGSLRGRWKLTASGHQVWRMLVEEA